MLLSPPLTTNCLEPPPETFSGVSTLAFFFAPSEPEPLPPCDFVPPLPLFSFSSLAFASAFSFAASRSACEVDVPAPALSELEPPPQAASSSASSAAAASAAIGRIPSLVTAAIVRDPRASSRFSTETHRYRTRYRPASALQFLRGFRSTHG
jgi:hypothetical protein